MKEYILNYYPNFKCIANKCKHTCCAGWEADIDKTTLEGYKTENSAFATTLKNGINFKKSTFKIDKNRRCAFLMDNGLCEIICNLGEERLCQICRDHPRFKSGFTGETITGLGFSCEESTKIILSFKDKIQPILVNDDNNAEELDFYEKFVMEFRVSALNILQDRSITINERLKKLLNLCNTGLDKKDYKKVLKRLLSLEKLNKSWAKRLKSIKNKPISLTANDNLSLYIEQFLVNSIYRHVSTAEDTLVAHATTIVFVYCWFIIQNLYQAESNDIALLFDIVREFSSEVEYSTKNLSKLFDFACKLIK